MCASRPSPRCASTPRAWSASTSWPPGRRRWAGRPSRWSSSTRTSGRSGAEATAREGFKNLVADVGLGKVGIILGIEVSRLARNNADWYQLLDLCALTDTLIADGDGLYHPADFNDRLVLGLEGHDVGGGAASDPPPAHRRAAHKAAKGELRQGLPVGFVYDEDDRVVLDPDEAVVEAIATVFRRFDELGSARQVMLSLPRTTCCIPRRPTGARRVPWAPASYPAIHDFLTNPTYAGAFVFGRTRTEKRLDANGRLVHAGPASCPARSGRC